MKRTYVLPLWVVALAGSGCGASVGSTASATLPSGPTTPVRSARLEVQTVLPDPGGGPPTRSDAVGEFDFVHHRGKLQDQPVPGTTTTTVMPNQDAILGHVGSGVSGPAIFVNGTMYSAISSLPFPVTAIPVGKRWVAQPEALLGQAYGSGSGAPITDILSGADLPFGPGVDPGLDLSALRPFVASSAEIGTSEIHDQHVVEYRLILDSGHLATSMKGASKSRPQPQDALTDFVNGVTGPNHPVELWLDPQGRTVRIHFTDTVTLTDVPPLTTSVTATYWAFGTHVAVSAPPPDQVASLSDLQGQFPCGLVNGTTAPPTQAFCSGGNSAPGPQAVTLPAYHGARSTVQFRRVASSAASGCPPPGSNPDPSAPARVPAAQGRTCYDLGPAQFILTHAHITGTYLVQGSYQVNIQLDGPDTTAFDRLAAANYQSQVAVVAFGEVLAAPTIYATSFHGQAEITGLNRIDAERVVSALTNT